MPSVFVIDHCAIRLLRPLNHQPKNLEKDRKYNCIHHLSATDYTFLPLDQIQDQSSVKYICAYNADANIRCLRRYGEELRKVIEKSRACLWDILVPLFRRIFLYLGSQLSNKKEDVNLYNSIFFFYCFLSIFPPFVRYCSLKTYFFLDSELKGRNVFKSQTSLLLHSKVSMLYLSLGFIRFC